MKGFETVSLEIVHEPIGRLESYVNNAKVHTAEQVEQIKASIQEFGFNDPVAVWTNAEGKSEIVEGHGRLIAALELGLEELPVIHLDHLTDEQRRAYTHVHNQLTMNTGWDFDTLEAELAELDFDWEGFGFDVGTELNDGESDDRSGNMERDFGFVPFSVIATTAAKWRERRDEWLSKGICSELGRGGGSDVQYLAVPGRSKLPLNRKGDRWQRINQR